MFSNKKIIVLFASSSDQHAAAESMDIQQWDGRKSIA
jgi:hypothetical protein